MEQKYGNNRASRSAYNYDNDRPYAAQNRGVRPQPQQSRGGYTQPVQTRGGRSQAQPRQNVPAGGRTANVNARPQRPQEPRYVNDRPVSGNAAAGRAADVPQRAARAVDPRRGNGQNVRPAQSRTANSRQPSHSPQGGNVRGNNAGRQGADRPQSGGRNGVRTQDERRSAPQKKSAGQARKNGGWVYPEGYKQSQQRRPDPCAGGMRSDRTAGGGGNRRPDTGRRNDRRQSRRLPAEKKPIITVDWQRVGVILFAVFGRFMICLCAVCIIMGMIYRNMFYSTHEPPADKVTYSFVTVEGEGEEATTLTDTLTFDSSYAYSDDELMISFSEVSKWLGTAQIGDVHSMRFVLGNGTDTSEDVVFHYNSQNAFINGAPIVMKAVARFDNGEIWVPLSFVSDYITGIEIVQETESVTLSFTGEEVSFVLRPSEALAPAEQPEE